MTPLEQPNLFPSSSQEPPSKSRPKAANADVSSGADAPHPADAARDEVIIAQVRARVLAIPEGRVMSYGGVGASCQPPINGYICGRIMNHAVSNIPWWRVVAKDGSLPIGKRNPTLAQEQRGKLEAEGVAFDAEGKVLSTCFD